MMMAYDASSVEHTHSDSYGHFWMCLVSPVAW